MSHVKKILIFDMDGTLIDSSEVICNSINHVRTKLDLAPLSKQNILYAVNEMHIHSPSYFYEAEAFEEHHILWFQDYYTANHHKEVRLYEGVENLLRKAKKQYKLSLATNAYRISALQILQHLDIEKHFEIIVCADDVKESKPQPDMLHKILDHFNLKAEEAYMIGDSLKDKEAATRAGIETILVDWGFSDLEDACREVGELEKRLKL